MFRLIILLILLNFTNTTANASVIDTAIARQLNALDPVERQEQRCDLEAMSQIARSKPLASPDKVIAYAFGNTKRDHRTLKAPGAVFRAHGNWYRLKYRCATSPDGLEVTKFIFIIGEQVDRSEWTSHFLYD